MKSANDMQPQPLTERWPNSGGRVSPLMRIVWSEPRQCWHAITYDEDGRITGLHYLATVLEDLGIAERVGQTRFRVREIV